MGRKRKHHAMLPKGVHVIAKPSGRKLYYWRPGRGTDKAGVSVRIPGTPDSPVFWTELNRLRKGDVKGGMARMIDAYQASPHYGQLAPATRREYDRYMEDCREHLGRFETDAIAPSDVAAIRDRFGETPAKANGYIRAIAACFAWGRERGFARDNPAEGIRKLKVGEHQPWTGAALALIASMRSEARIACQLGRYTGQRLGDILRMQLGHIQGDLITVRQAKTGKTLQIPLHRELKPIIAECRERGAIYLVSKPNGEAFTVDQFHAMWGREMRKEPQKGIRAGGFVFHGLRKSATVKLAEAGCSEKQIAAITGMSMAMVAHYSKGADQVKLGREAMAKLEKSGVQSAENN
jgi:integrase